MGIAAGGIHVHHKKGKKNRKKGVSAKGARGAEGAAGAAGAPGARGGMQAQGQYEVLPTITVYDQQAAAVTTGVPSYQGQGQAIAATAVPMVAPTQAFAPNPGYSFAPPVARQATPSYAQPMQPMSAAYAPPSYAPNTYAQTAAYAPAAGYAPATYAPAAAGYGGYPAMQQAGQMTYSNSNLSNPEQMRLLGTY